MKQGTRMPARVNELYASEIKYGYDKKLPRFMYLIDGERFRLRDVLEQSRPLGLKDFTIMRRLLSHSSHTWAEVLRPAEHTGKARNETDQIAANAKRSKKRRWAIAIRKAAEEKRAYLAAKKQDHKPL